MINPLILAVALLALLVVALLAFAGCGFSADGQMEPASPAAATPPSLLPPAGPPPAGPPPPPVQIAPLYGDVILAEPTLVGYWRLGEAMLQPPPLETPARDSGKLKRDGTYSKTGIKLAVKGALTLDPDTAAHFNGAAGVVVVPYDMRLNPPLNFSIEAWIRPDKTNPATAVQSLLSSRQIGVDPATGQSQISGFELTVVRDPAPTAQHGIMAKVGSGTAADHQPFVPLAWPQGDWVHVVLVAEVAPSATPTLTLYINSKPTSLTLPSNLPPNPPSYRRATGRPLRIGAGRSDQPNAADFFAGALDEVAIYNSALSAAKVTKHYNAR